MKVYDAIVVGAGISGLSARRALTRAGLSVLVLEKSRGVGGRASTKRFGNSFADMGAQFTAATQPSWREVVASGDTEVVPVRVPGDSHFRFVHKKGMNSFAKLLIEKPLIQDSPILFEKKANRLSVSGEAWRIETECHETFESKRLILTAPVPQSLVLLESSGLKLSNGDAEILNAMDYLPCIALIAVLNNSCWPQSRDPIVKKPNEDLDGIFDQCGKGLDSEHKTWVIHASAEWSQKHWDEDESVIQDQLWKIALDTLRLSSDAVEVESFKLHQWRYCEPRKIADQKFLSAVLPGCPTDVYFAGDAFGRSSLEGAFLSGEAAAIDLIKKN